MTTASQASSRPPSLTCACLDPGLVHDRLVECCHDGLALIQVGLHTTIRPSQVHEVVIDSRIVETL